MWTRYDGDLARVGVSGARVSNRDWPVIPWKMSHGTAQEGYPQRGLAREDRWLSSSPSRAAEHVRTGEDQGRHSHLGRLLDRHSTAAGRQPGQLEGGQDPWCPASRPHRDGNAVSGGTNQACRKGGARSTRILARRRRAVAETQEPGEPGASSRTARHDNARTAIVRKSGGEVAKRRGTRMLYTRGRQRCTRWPALNDFWTG